MVVSIALLALLGKLADQGVRGVERRLLSWSDGFRHEPGQARGQPVRLERVRKAYSAGRPVFGGLDLEVQAAEVVALLGGSGCGKSTLVRLVAGLERADGGVVRVGERAVNGPLEHVGLMFQEPRLLPWLDAAANVAFGLADDVRGTAGEPPARPLSSSSRWAFQRPGRCSRTSSPAGWRSGWRWRARWPGRRTCCSSTSPSAPSMRSPATGLQNLLLDVAAPEGHDGAPGHA